MANDSITDHCACQRPCHFNQYTTSVSTAKFPSDFMAEQYEKLGIISAARVKLVHYFIRKITLHIPFIEQS